MSVDIKNLKRNRVISSYISVVISISVALFLFGLFSFIIYNIKNVSDNFKESLIMSIYLDEKANKVDINQLKNSLLYSNYIKKLDFISKNEAVSIMKTEFGEDFINELGYNPLVNSFDVNLVSDYVETNSIDSLANIIKNKTIVNDVQYDNDLVSIMNSNIKKISVWIIPITIILMIISILIINSSIKLSIYSKRFTIKTMQLVGATKQFIRKPFILKNITLGLYSSIISIIFLYLIINYIDQKISFINLLDDIFIIYLSVIIIFLGIIITSISTYFATQKLLKINIDKLYT
jgi:cell division transport system permease protein